MATSVGFIGAGAMGAAILRGLADRNDLELHAFDVDQAKLTALSKELGLTTHASPEDLAGSCDIIVMAVKPQHLGAAAPAAAGAAKPGACLVSIAAGVTSQTLREWTGGKLPVVREGVFAVCLEDPLLSEQMAQTVLGLFQPLGQAHVLAEKQFDAFTAVIGSGPAYVLYFMEALIESAVNLGLPRDAATTMVLGLFEGTSAMALQSDFHVSVLREMVTSPGGTTVRGLAHLDRCAVRAAILDATEEAFDRSVELGD
jgi:pyrroline-5-carboxylate reductase